MPVRAPDEIDRIIRTALQTWRVPGVAVAIVHGEQPPIVRAYGVADQTTQEPLTATHVFPIASCTKAFTAVLVARLAEEGRLSFDDPVRKHLPEFRLSDPHADALVTLRDLLAHRTGVAGHDLLWYRSPWPHAELIQRFGSLPLSRPFRGAYQYSTLQYMAAGEAAAQAAGLPWEVALRERLLVPLGMDQAACTSTEPAFLKAIHARGHRLGMDGKPTLMPRYDMPRPNPAGSIHLAVRDLPAWLTLQVQAGSWNGTSIVAQRFFLETQEPQIIIPMDENLKRYHPETVQMAYCMGWIASDYRGLRTLSHGGMIDGFRSQMLIIPEKKLGLALLNNLHDSRMNLALGNSLVDHLLGLPPRDWNALIQHAVEKEQETRRRAWQQLEEERARLKPAPTLSLIHYAGRFHHEAYGEAEVLHEAGRLVWKWSSFTVPLEHWGNDQFLLRLDFTDGQYVEFQVDSGSVKSLRFQGVDFIRRQ